MGSAQDRGKVAERLAAAFLEFEGFDIVARNVRFGGVEIDIVAREGSTRVLVEVKARGRTDFGGATGAIDRKKRERLLRAARALLAESPGPVRIDVVAVEPEGDGLRMRQYRNAVTE
jgi:putative endonuclease